MDTAESSAPRAHPYTEDYDDTLEAHYACLERPCACLDGWVFVGYADEHGEERKASYRCRRCADGTRWRSQKWGSAGTALPHSPLRQAVIKAQRPREDIARLR